MNEKIINVTLFFLMFNSAVAMEKSSALVTLAGGELTRGSFTLSCAQEMNEPVAHGVRLGSFVLFGLGSSINGMASLPALVKPELSLGMLLLGNSLVYFANKAERIAWEALYEQQRKDLNLNKEEFTRNHSGLRALWSGANAANAGGSSLVLFLTALGCYASEKGALSMLPVLAASYFGFKSLCKICEVCTFINNWEPFLASKKRSRRS